MERTFKNRISLRAAALLLAAALMFCALTACGGRAAEPAPRRGNGLFSWHGEAFDPEARAAMLQLMKEQGLTELYQDIAHDRPVSEVRALLDACAEAGVRVYLLVGAPEWALDASAAALLAEIQRAALMGCAGVLVDVEPGGTKEWHADRAAVMQTMTESFLRAQAAAVREGLELIVCLSWYYDDYGFDSELERIVAEGCGALAIMNYDRTDEIGQIRTEATLCRRYGRPLICIYELQEAGRYGLEDVNTYHDAGLDALRQSWEALAAAYPDVSLTAAMHEYRALRALAEPS